MLHLEKLDYPKEYLKQHEDYYSSGAGAFADVFVHKSKNEAIKLLRSYDAGYEYFLDAILDSKNTLFPKIYNIVTLKSGFLAVFLERLFHPEYFGSNTVFIAENFHKRLNHLYCNVNDKAWQYIEPNIRDALETINLAEQIAHDNKLMVYSDFTFYNMMFRNENQIVITDPLYDNDTVDDDRGSGYYRDTT